MFWFVFESSSACKSSKILKQSSSNDKNFLISIDCLINFPLKFIKYAEENVFLLRVRRMNEQNTNSNCIILKCELLSMIKTIAID